MRVPKSSRVSTHNTNTNAAFVGKVRQMSELQAGSRHILFTVEPQNSEVAHSLDNENNIFYTMDRMHYNNVEQVALRRQLRVAMLMNTALVGFGLFFMFTGFSIISNPREYLKPQRNDKLNFVSMMSGALLGNGFLLTFSGLVSTVVGQASWCLVNAPENTE